MFEHLLDNVRRGGGKAGWGLNLNDTWILAFPPKILKGYMGASRNRQVAIISRDELKRKMLNA